MILYMPKSTDGPVSRYINRRVSGAITYLIVRSGAPLTPNQVSVISFLMGIFAAALYVVGNPIAGGIMVQLASIVDGVDGELARAKGMSSRAGAFLDAVLDRFVDIAVVAALTLTAARTGSWGFELVLFAGALALSGSLMVSYIHARGDNSLGVHPSKVGSIPNFSSRDVRLFAIFIGSVAGLYLETLLFIAALSYTYVSVKTLEVFIKTRRGGAQG